MLINRPFWRDVNTSHLYSFLVSNTTLLPGEDGVLVGEMVTNLTRLSLETGLSIQNLRTSIKKLEVLGLANRILTGYQQDTNRISTGYQQDTNRILTGKTYSISVYVKGVTQQSKSQLTGYQQDTNRILTGYQQDINRILTGYQQGKKAKKKKEFDPMLPIPAYIEKFLSLQEIHHQVKIRKERIGIEKYIEDQNIARVKLIKMGYTDEQIRAALNGALTDDFWKNQILSLHKLYQKNKDKVLYIDVLLDVRKRYLAKDNKDGMR